jgi:hypothetical protein
MLQFSDWPEPPFSDWLNMYPCDSRVPGEIFSVSFPSPTTLFADEESFFNVCGSFTWLYYNRPNILENQTLLLARVRFIQRPWQPEGAAFQRILGAACSVTQ